MIGEAGITSRVARRGGALPQAAVPMAGAVLQRRATVGGAQPGHDAMARPQPVTQVIRFRREQDIYRPGESGGYSYGVLDGMVRSVAVMRDGRRQVGAFFLKGDRFGFDTGERQDYGAEAVIDCTLVRYPRCGVDSLADGDPAFAVALCGIVRRQLREARAHLLSLGRGTAKERVAAFLLAMRSRMGDDGRTLALPMPRGDIADHLGLTVETVSRVLNGLHRQGIISLETPHRVVVADASSLSAIAEMR